MTDQEWQDIGRRAVACKHWRWMPGMLARYSADAWYRTSEVDSVGIPVRVRPPNPRSAWPDLRDPATLGCLLALVRKAWGRLVWISLDVEHDPLDDNEFVPCEPTRFTVWRATDGNYSQPCGTGRTEAEALVAALEVAP